MNLKLSLLLVSLTVSQLTASSFSFLPGSIQGQDGWNGGTVPIPNVVDQQVTGAAFRSGNQSFQFSNRFSGGFSGFPFGPSLSVAAGQPSANTNADSMFISFWFRSASAVADGTDVEFDFGSSARDDRNTFLAVRNNTDANGGLQIRLAEPNGPGPNAPFFPTLTVVNSLARGTWHNISMTYYGVDGAPDYYTVSLNGGAPIVSPNTTLARWNSFEAFRSAIDPYVTVDNLFIRSNRLPSAVDASFVDADVLGLYIDDVEYGSFNQALPSTLLASYNTSFDQVPEPGTYAMMIAGLGAVVALRRRR